MADRILYVDDDPNIVEGYKRQLRKAFELATAVGPEQGLGIVTEEGPFAVVADLVEGMILTEDIQSSQHVLLASKGQQVTHSMIMRLQSFGKTVGVREPFRVLLQMTLEGTSAGIPAQAMSQPAQMLTAS